MNLMEQPIPHALKRTHRWALILAVGAFAVTAVVALGVGSAGAAKVKVLGAGPPATPACPNNCTVEAKVTGFQTAIGNSKKPFMVGAPGKIVAWSIKLGSLKKKDVDFFNGSFGGASRARLAILRPVKGKNLTFELKAQSPVESLRPFFGSTTTFALDRPLKVKKRDVAALTVVSWAPMFAANLGSSNTWRASRKATKSRGPCSFPASDGGGANIKSGSPQQGLNKSRFYGCQYAGNRLLYSASLVRSGGG